MALTGLHPTDYETALKAWIISKEGSKTSVLKVHTDGVGVPTIGAGYALTSHSATWTGDFTTAGITITAVQQTALQALISESDAYLKDTTLTTAQKESQVKALVDTYNASANAITLSSTQVGELFLAIKGKYEQIVKDKLGTALYNSLANTKELVALVDLAYNGYEALFGPGLVNALKNNDRAEAWFQIRYQSNGGNSYNTVGVGMAERRIAESTLFDLYPTNPTEDDYKKIMRMYTNNKSTIMKKEADPYAPPGNNPRDKDGNLINPPLKTVGDAYINHKAEDEILPAKTLLIDKYSQGVEIDGDIIVGQGIGNEGEAYADTTTDIDDTNLQGTEKNDLIFGERGDDTLIGGEGSDVLYGGSGDDTYQSGNGDTILDSDHQGKVFLAGHLLTGGSSIQGETNKYKGDYGEIYTLDTIHDTLHVKLEDEEITIKNYDEYKQSLGIALGKKITVTLDDAKVNEGDTMSIGVHIDTTLSQDITFCIMTGEESASESKDYIGFGENSKPYYFIKHNILTCKDFHTNKSLHVRTKIKQKGARYEAQPKVA